MAPARQAHDPCWKRCNEKSPAEFAEIDENFLGDLRTLQIADRRLPMSQDHVPLLHVLLSHHLNGPLQSLRQRCRKVTEILDQHPPLCQPTQQQLGHREHAKRPPKPHPIEPTERPENVFLMLRDKLVHGIVVSRKRMARTHHQLTKQRRLCLILQPSHATQ